MEKRVQIIDFNHQVHTYFHSSHRLSTKVVVNGEVVEKDTTIQNGCIKNIHRWSKGGVFPTAVCFDRPVPARKAFWQSAFSDMEIGSGNEYKGNRKPMPDAMFEACSDCLSLLKLGGVSCFSRKNYEADDLIYACVQRAKVKYPDYKIDVITNDADLLTLVDDRVSVFLRSRKITWAENKDIEKLHYVQVTPQNYREVVEDLSAYKGFMIPYNSILLHKLLRGDSSDQFQRKEISRMFPKTKYNDMICRMLADDVNFDEIFRYSRPKYEVYNVATNTVFEGTMEEAKKSPERSNLRLRLGDSEELTMILELLDEYSPLTSDQLDVVRTVYLGMNLNQPYANPNKELCRHEYVVGKTEKVDIEKFDEIELNKAVSALQIRLPIK